MKSGIASRTAYGVALSRAAHQVWDTPKLLHDPVALPLLGESGPEMIEAARKRLDGRHGRKLRAFIVARGRFADEELALAYAQGVRHCVVLGAGLDTIAYRHPHADLTVYEVDHPSTQAWKKARLREAGISAPGNMRFLPVDLAQEDLARVLAAQKLTRERPVFFSLLGVSMYLPPEALANLLQLVASWAPGSRLVFDYVIPAAHLPVLLRMRYRLFMLRVARLGEPWTGLFDPAALGAQMRALPFEQVTDLAAADINARYFRDRSDGLAVGPTGHLVSVVR